MLKKRIAKKVNEGILEAPKKIPKHQQESLDFQAIDKAMDRINFSDKDEHEGVAKLQ